MTVLKVVTIFFSEFLHIRPFDNDNGRTAYLLVNVMLAPFTAVPFVGNVIDEDDGDANELYSEILSEHKKHEAPTTLLSYLLLCLKKTSTDYLYLMLM
jgi:Fic family protein